MSLTKDQIQDEALDAIGTKDLAGVKVSMGVGKTLLGLKHMAKNYSTNSMFLVVAPRRTIFTSWIDDAEKFGYQYLTKHIHYVTYLSLNKMDLDYDIVYLDECHSLKENHEAWLNEFTNQGGKILGLTGTYPVRAYSEKGKMCNKFCPLVYEYNTDDAVDDNILNDYRIFVHMLKLDGTPNMPVKMKNGNTFNTSEVKSYHFWSSKVDEAQNDKQKAMARIQRMKAMQKFPSKIKYAKKLFDMRKHKTIVFVNTKEQADLLCAHSIHSGKSKKEYEELLNLFKSGDIDGVSAVDMLSEGITVPNLKTGIICHAYANNRKAAQKLGRLLRLNPDDVSNVHILCYTNTIDKDWVTQALSHLDQSKIKWIDPIFK